jgi:hypothetical protein
MFGPRRTFRKRSQDLVESALVGRLDNILQRNRKRRLSGDRIAVTMTSVVVLVVVILLIVTLMRPGPAPRPAPPKEPVRVPVELYRAPQPTPPAGSAQTR